MGIKSNFLGTHTMGKAMSDALRRMACKKEPQKVEAPLVGDKIAYAEAEKLGFVKSARALGRNAFEATCDLGKVIDSGSVWTLTTNADGQKFFVKQIDEAGNIVRKLKASKTKSVKVTFAEKTFHAPVLKVVEADYKRMFGVTPEEVEKNGKEIGEDTEDEGYITKFYDFNGKSYFISKAIGDNLVASFGEIESEAKRDKNESAEAQLGVKAESLMEKIQHELISVLQNNDKRDGMPFEVSDTLGGETSVYDFNLKEDLDEFKKDIGELGYEVVSVNAGVATVQKKRVEEASSNEKKVEASKEVKAEVLPYSADEIAALVKDVNGFYGVMLDEVQTKELADILFNKEKETVDSGKLFTDFDWKATVESFLSSKEEKKEVEAAKSVVAEEKPEEQVFNTPEEATSYINDKRKSTAMPPDKVYETKKDENGKFRLVPKTASVEKKAEEPIDEVAANELYIFAVNDSDLYRQMLQPIQKNLINKKAQGVYNPTLALKAFMNFMQIAAQKYTKEYASDRDKWYDLFPVEVRKAAANEALKYFETEAELGNYDNYLHKKYQKKPAAPTPEVTPPVEADMNKEGSHKVKAEDEETGELNMRLESAINRLIEKGEDIDYILQYVNSMNRMEGEFAQGEKFNITKDELISIITEQMGYEIEGDMVKKASAVETDEPGSLESIKLSFYSTDESTGGKYYLDENDNVYKTVEGVMYECTDEGEPLAELKAPYEIIETETVEE